jgi:F-type H+-transporting ATPase subunit epsilon
MSRPTRSGSPASDDRRIDVPLTVELVSAERKVWSGEANFVVARTLDGELGILPGHISLLGVLAEGFTVRITGGEAGDGIEAAAHGGFLSVSHDVVTILTEIAELSTEIDVERARAALERAIAAGGDDAENAANESAAARARARLAAAGQPV